MDVYASARDALLSLTRWAGCRHYQMTLPQVPSLNNQEEPPA